MPGSVDLPYGLENFSGAIFRVPARHNPKRGFLSWRKFLLPPLRPRVELLMYRLQSRFVYVRIELGRRNIGVAQHLLYDPQVRALF